MRRTAIEKTQRLYDALKTIAQYQSPERLRKSAERQYGLGFEEALEMAYENVIETAKHAIKGMQRPELEPRTDKATGESGEK